MSFLKKLFGGGDDGGAGGDKVLGTETYKDFTIRAIEMRAGGEFQLCGEISKFVGGEEKIHRFIRADRLTTADVASDMALRKGRQIVDEQGDRLFG
ncbi:MAG: hypothetical protein H6873_11950 [Hyphomicrobiaceae bacterium]|nr:hypothetical protein [Hyphomicrobiaceae bacterium]